MRKRVMVVYDEGCLQENDRFFIGSIFGKATFVPITVGCEAGLSEDVEVYSAFTKFLDVLDRFANDIWLKLGFAKVTFIWKGDLAESWFGPRSVRKWAVKSRITDVEVVSFEEVLQNFSRENLASCLA